MDAGLRQLLFGNVSHRFSCEWTQACSRFREPYSDLAYALEAEERGTRAVLMAVQAHIIKYLLFVRNTEYTHLERLCRISRREQGTALAAALADTLWAAGGGRMAIICLITTAVHAAPSRDHRADSFTERVQLFEFGEKAAAQEFIFDHINCFRGEGSHGVILYLYSLLFSRTLERYISFVSLFSKKTPCCLHQLYPGAPGAAEAFHRNGARGTPSVSGVHLTLNLHLNGKALKARAPAEHPVLVGPALLCQAAPRGRGSTEGSGQHRGVGAAQRIRESMQFLPVSCRSVMTMTASDAVVTPCACSRLQEDLGCTATPLLKSSSGNITCTEALLSLLLRGRAIPCELDVGHEPWRGGVGGGDGGAKACRRSPVGYLRRDRAPAEPQVCRGLRTPRLPVWLCGTAGRHGVLFSTDMQLLRDWRVERRFPLLLCSGRQAQSTTARLTVGTDPHTGHMGWLAHTDHVWPAYRHSWVCQVTQVDSPHLTYTHPHLQIRMCASAQKTAHKHALRGARAGVTAPEFPPAGQPRLCSTHTPSSAFCFAPQSVFTRAGVFRPFFNCVSSSDTHSHPWEEDRSEDPGKRRPSLEMAVRSKWAGATITWNGTDPFF
nr:inactive ubiquitin carboxyl-terminal hydrolase MINDY-4B [Columba livia]